jgi:hypothetical protein
MQRLSNNEADKAIRELGIDDTSVGALKAAHRLHEFYHPVEASGLIEQYAQSEAEKVQKSIAGER